MDTIHYPYRYKIKVNDPFTEGNPVVTYQGLVFGTSWGNAAGILASKYEDKDTYIEEMSLVPWEEAVMFPAMELPEDILNAIEKSSEVIL